MSESLVRLEGVEDLEAIRRIHRAAFPGDDESRLVDLLRENSNLFLSLVAVLASNVVGHVAFSPVRVEKTPGSVGVGLGPVGVLPEFQSQGIGDQLIREGLRICLERSIGFVVLLGHQSYYPRFGFRRASLFGLGNEYGADEAFMVLELKEGAMPADGGLVRYSHEFGELGE